MRSEVSPTLGQQIITAITCIFLKQAHITYKKFYTELFLSNKSLTVSLVQQRAK